MCHIVIFASVSLVCSSVLSSFFLSVGTQNNINFDRSIYFTKFTPAALFLFPIRITENGSGWETDVVGAPGEILPGRQVL